MADLERIKRKIAKLMNLASGTSNEHEAKNAMMKAARLMNSFHIKEGEATTNPMVSVAKNFGDRKTAKAYEQKLFFNICASMGVFALYTCARNPIKRKGKIIHEGIPCKFTLTGHDCDVSVAWYMFEVCVEKIAEQTKSYRSGKNMTRSETNDYSAGLVLGLCRRFLLMKKSCDEQSIGTGLVPVDTREKDAEDFYNASGGIGYTESKALKTRPSEHTGAGIQDADSIRIDPAVNGESKSVAKLSHANV